MKDEQKVVVTSYGRNKNHEEIKNHSRTSPDAQFKEFALTKQKLDLKQTISELGKPFPKNLKTKQKIYVKMPHVNKNHQREMEIWFKQKN